MRRLWLLAGPLALTISAPAFAQSDIFSPTAFSGVLDLRVAAADGERSWLDGGFSKSRFGGDADGDFAAHAQVADAILQWHPILTWSLTGVVDLEYQGDQDHPFGVTEAYVRYKPLVGGPTRYSVRAGLFYPPVSQEHDGTAWTTSRTITPSAINSWIGEEVLSAGIEGKVSRTFGGHEVDLTVGAFGLNDTAGTLLTFRGWSISDARATAGGDYALPPLTPFIAMRQRDRTTPVLELDDRIGYYVRADWKPPAAVAFNATYYNNEGDKVGVDANSEWSWRTQFTNLGASWRPADNTEVLGQAMMGNTKMGYPFPSGVWVDLDYEFAYVLVSQTLGQSAVTARLDAFSTDDKASPTYGDNSEDGWGLTAGWRRDLTAHAQLMLEVGRTQSTRPSRALAGEPPKQTQTVVQASTRLSF